MNKPSTKLCPKCGKPYIEKRKYNTNYDIYIHKRQPDTLCFNGMLEYCVVTIGYDYIHPVKKTIIRKLHPDYRKKKLQD